MNKQLRRLRIQATGILWLRVQVEDSTLEVDVQIYKDELVIQSTPSKL